MAGEAEHSMCRKTKAYFLPKKTRGQNKSNQGIGKGESTECGLTMEVEIRKIRKIFLVETKMMKFSNFMLMMARVF